MFKSNPFINENLLFFIAYLNGIAMGLAIAMLLK